MGGLESLRFFADDKSANLPFVGHKHVEFDSEEYHQLIKEMQAAGAGAFFSVNGTDGLGAKAENINRVRTYYVDVDGLQDKDPVLGKLIQAKLKPSAIVETKNGVHAYWYAAQQTPVDYALYRKVQLGLIRAFGGDKSAKDIARVLRIPGTLHQKNPDDPFVVRIVHQLPEDRVPYYHAEQILDVYPAPVEKEFPPIIMQNNPRLWNMFLDDLKQWSPVPGDRNSVMLLSAGVAISFGVGMESYVNTMYPIVRNWGTGRNVQGELRRVARWAYERGNPIPASALRSRGVPIRRGL
jgi:hypothetical protein